MDITEPLVSIIIPTFNRDELLNYGLHSIASLENPYPTEILVLDEFNGPNTINVCKQFNNVRYIQTRPDTTPENMQWRVPGLAINYGVRQAKGKIIIIACPEIYHYDKNNIINLVTPLLTATKLVTFTDGIDDNGELLSKMRMGNNPKVAPSLHTTPLNTKFPFFLAMNKEDFIAVGGYDEDFQQGYCWDDTNFCRRLDVYGCEFRQVAGLICHIYHKRLRYGLNEVKTLWAKNQALYLARYNDVVANVGKEWGQL